MTKKIRKQRPPISEETRKKLSDAKKGQVPWNKGKPAWNRGIPRPEEEKKRISETMKRHVKDGTWFNPMTVPENVEKMKKNRKGKLLGIPLTEDHKKKIGDALRGKKRKYYPRPDSRERFLNNNPMHCEETCKKISEFTKNNPILKIPGAYEKWWDAIHSEEYRTKRIESWKTNWVRSDHLGKNASNWRGGISFEPYCPKFNDEFKERVRLFFKRECIICGKSEYDSHEKLCVHHVEYNKQACCDGKPVHFAALCRSCHSKTNGNREWWEDIIHRIIDEIYDGRSYYTKEEISLGE